MTDMVKKPAHYLQHPSGVECRTIAQEFGFNLGCVVKYVWRAGLKSDDVLTDLRKARQYLDFEIERLTKKRGTSRIDVIGQNGNDGLHYDDGVD